MKLICHFQYSAIYDRPFFEEMANENIFFENIKNEIVKSKVKGSKFNLEIKKN